MVEGSKHRSRRDQKRVGQKWIIYGTIIIWHTLHCQFAKPQNSRNKTAVDKQWDKLQTLPAWTFFFVNKSNSSYMQMSMTSILLGEKPTRFPCRSLIKCIWNAFNLKQNLKGITSTIFKRKYLAMKSPENLSTQEHRDRTLEKLVSSKVQHHHL